MAPPVARQNLPTENLFPNDYNPNVMDEETRKRLFEFIQQVKRVPSDLWVRCVDQIGSDHTKHKHEIIDGFNRWDVARKLGLRAVPCEIYQVSDLAAMGMCYRINKVRGTPLPFQEAAFFYLVRKRLPPNKRSTADIAAVVGESRQYVESRLLLWTVAPVAKEFPADAIPVAIWEELAKSMRTDVDLGLVKRAAEIILPNAKDFLPGNVRNVVASLRRQESRDIETLHEAVRLPTEHTAFQSPFYQPVIRPSKEPLRKESSSKTPSAKHPSKSQEPSEPKPALVLSSRCYICGAKDVIRIWTKSGTDECILKVTNSAELKSFEKNLVQERKPSETADIKQERVLVSKP